MPIYEYACTACDHRTDILHGINDPGPNFCPSCGAEGTMRKLFAPPTIHFKGSGWAKKDRGSSSASRSSASSKSSGDGASASSDEGSLVRSGSSSSDSGRLGLVGLVELVGLVGSSGSSSVGLVRLSGSDSGPQPSGPTGWRLTCPAAADWITLAEAAEILAAANVQFRPETIGALGAHGQPVEHQARRPALRPARRGQGAGRGPAPGARGGPPARAVRGPAG